MTDRVRQYQEAMLALDADALAELRHADYECVYPQSGERFHGHENWAAAHDQYESRFSGESIVDLSTKGGVQKAKVARVPSAMPFASSPIIQVSDTGELVVIEGKGMWPDDKTYHWVLIIEYRDGLVWRETQYFAEPFDAPEWRAPFTEPAGD